MGNGLGIKHWFVFSKFHHVFVSFKLYHVKRDCPYKPAKIVDVGPVF
jgi:hypothetical protein